MGTSRRAGAGVEVGLCVLVMAVILVAVEANNIRALNATAPLTTTFYDRSCPKIYSIVKAEVKKAADADIRMPASLIRLHFHDCFVNGCDGSVLLDAAPGFETEKLAIGNDRSLRGFDVIDTIKAKLEKACPRTVSCADILALAYRDSAVQAGLTIEYPVYFGRRDSLTASRAQADESLPSAGATYTELKDNFGDLGLDETDLIALSGAHTIGRVRCGLVRFFLNDTNIDAEFRKSLDNACPAGGDPFIMQNLDLKTPDKFDNNYYKNLRRGEGILTSDQVLHSTPGPNVAMVKDFAQNQEKFFDQFALSSIKMGAIPSPITGNQGQIRVNCRVVNPLPLVAFE